MSFILVESIHIVNIFILIMKEKWKEVQEVGELYYNVNFSHDRSEFALKIQ